MFWTLGSKVDSGVTRPFFTFSADLLASYPFHPLSFSHSFLRICAVSHKGKPNKTSKDDYKIIRSKANTCNPNKNIDQTQRIKTTSNNKKSRMYQTEQEQL